MVATPTPHVHRYPAALEWAGTTALGYERYDRSHRVRCAPVATELALSSDPAFLGDPAELDPERLLVAAASSCQLLSFLAVAARARLDVVRYADEAVGEMPDDARPMRLTRIALRPRVTLRGRRVGEDRLRRLTDLAHRECFVANSLSGEIVVEPTFAWLDDAPARGQS